MKKLVFILTLTLLTGLVTKAQDEEYDRIRDKMKEFIQKRLHLSKKEAERFTPVFIRYFREWRTSLRETDLVLRQQKIAEVRLRYRPEFSEIVGEARQNAVYRQQDIFIQEITKIRQERIESRRPRVNRLNELR